MDGTKSTDTPRELVEPTRGDKRYVRRDKRGRFAESDDTGRSLAADIKQSAHEKVESGHGDRGDRKKDH